MGLRFVPSRHKVKSSTVFGPVLRDNKFSVGECRWRAMRRGLMPMPS